MKNRGIIILAALMCTILLGVTVALLYAIRPSSITTQTTAVTMDAASAQAETERLIAQAKEQRRAEIAARVNTANEIAVASAVNPIEVARGNTLSEAGVTEQPSVTANQPDNNQTTEMVQKPKEETVKTEEPKSEEKKPEETKPEETKPVEAEKKQEEPKASLNSSSVYNTIMAYRNKAGYTQGTSWTNDNKSYAPNSAWYDKFGFTGANGCAAFAYELSDAAFGNAPIKVHTDQSAIKVGDVLRCTSDLGSHKVIVIGVSDSEITIAEGNFNSAVNWGRTISRSELASYCNDIITRY